MNDILTFVMVAVCCLLLFGLQHGIIRMTRGNSIRIRRYRQTAAIGILCILWMLPWTQNIVLDTFRQLMRVKGAQAFQSTVFVRRNYQVFWVLMFLLYANLLATACGWLVTRIFEAGAGRGNEQRAHEASVSLWKRLLCLPWQLAELCYEECGKGFVLRPWAAILGRWTANLAAVLRIILWGELLAGWAALYLKIPFLQYDDGAARLSWYLLPSISWLAAETISGFLGVCPQEASTNMQAQRSVSGKNDRVVYGTSKNAQGQSGAEVLCGLLCAGTSAAVRPELSEQEDGVKLVLPDWMIPWLYHCFAERKRVMVICESGEEARWNAAIVQGFAAACDGICPVRIAGAMEIRNRQDCDLLLMSAKELVCLEPDLVFPFWYEQAQAVLVTQTHRLLARTGGRTDSLFALWNRKKQRMQYVFLNCSGSAQEAEALRYYAAQPVAESSGIGKRRADGIGGLDRMGVDRAAAVQGEGTGLSRELVLWCLDSQAGRMRRLLLAMERENGVPEAWLLKQQQRLGMDSMGSEEFLRQVLKTVFPEYPVMNLYDSFLFWESPEADGLKSSWRIRLTDRELMRRLNWEESPAGIDQGMKEDPCAKEERSVKNPVSEGSEKETLHFSNQIYTAGSFLPLMTVRDQDKKRMILYQVTAKQICLGRFSYPVQNGVIQWKQETYEETEMSDGGKTGVSDGSRTDDCAKCGNENAGTFETTLLRILIPQKTREDNPAFDSALLSFVCNQVLPELFPWNKGEIEACCQRTRGNRSILIGLEPEEDQKPSEHCITLDLLETGAHERGLNALLRICTRELMQACADWLRRAAGDHESNEGQLFAFGFLQAKEAVRALVGLERTEAVSAAGISGQSAEASAQQPDSGAELALRQPENKESELAAADSGRDWHMNWDENLEQTQTEADREEQRIWQAEVTKTAERLIRLIEG